jgi:hypothetical protein
VHVCFSLEVVKWIMGCVTSMSFDFLINGLASNLFKCTMDLRQGCPLLFSTSKRLEYY